MGDCNCKSGLSSVHSMLTIILVVMVLASGLNVDACDSVGTHGLDYAAWSHARGAL